MNLKLVTMEIRNERDVVLARQRARSVAAALKFDVQAQTRLATAVSEIARNAFQYAGNGWITFEIDNGPEKMLIISVRDRGRGIANLDEIFAGKYVSKTGMGLGIVGAKRLSDYFHIESSGTEGTVVTLGKTIPGRVSHLSPEELNALLATVERKATEDPYAELQQQNKELMRTLEELQARQMELAQLNRELDETNRGVVALYAELNDKADFLQRASELKSHFLSNMSHEFRTPLNSILALSQILLDRMDGDLSPEQEKQVSFVRRSAQDLTDLVNDLLDLAKVEAGKVSIRTTDFSVESLFAALRGMLRPLLAQNSSVSLVFEDPVELPELHTDEAKISQILRNFISNALKFTERGEVRVSAYVHGNVVTFCVADSGIGIASVDQERIFQEWVQVEGKIQKTAKGTGLGLPLSRKLAQLLGGDVYVKSQVGVGSTFFAALPVCYTGEAEAVYVPDIKRELDASKLPVLVVEDNREALFIYEKYLKGTDFQVIPAQDLREARKALGEFQPVAIVLDILLQGEHSWQFLQELRHDPETEKIPVFVVTVVENEKKALALGASGFHAKPIDRGWLLNQLQSNTGRDPRKILIVDDDEISRYLVKGLLANRGYRVLEAHGGSEGLRLARENRPNLIVLDLSMPDLNGFQVLDSLKNDAETKDIPVVIYTSKKLESQDRARLCEAVDIIPKALESREQAGARFAEALGRAGLNQEFNN